MVMHCLGIQHELPGSRVPPWGGLHGKWWTFGLSCWARTVRWYIRGVSGQVLSHKLIRVCNHST